MEKEYNTINIKEAEEWLGKLSQETISYVIKAKIQNYFWREEKKEEAKYKKRFDIPKGENKKFYKRLLKRTKRITKLWSNKYKENIENILIEDELDKWILKRDKLKKMIHRNSSIKNKIQKAKSYPIENLIDFNNAGFALCIEHNEKTPSMKWYKDTNKAHCFGCGKTFDTIDAFMIINNVDFNEAIEKLND
ncbi:MAG: CHC2 zinc finger domain-containing protein [Patescibacteria group bacterium]|nr:CHC2 zinc finger domain-containing protein [Patescibacteria group bacterium]